MTLITDTYLLININQINAFKEIEHFNLDLGTKLINESKQFIPNDINVQKHYMFFNKIINKCGNIGTLQIYSSFNVPIGTIELYNEKQMLKYNLNQSNNLYDEINNALDKFFDELGLNTEIKPKTKTEEKTKEKYIKPNKPLNKMNMEERVAYLRNLK